MVVSFLTEQGGVGKTSLVFNLGWYLSTKGYKTLLIDLDPQGGNLSRLLGVKNLDEKAGVVDNLQDGSTYSFSKISINIKENLDVIPANEGAIQIPDVYKENGLDEKCLKKSIDKVKKKYDYIFIDTSPAPSISHVLSLTASDMLVIPLAPDTKSIDATSNVIDTYNMIKENYNSKLKIGGLVYNKFEKRTSIARIVCEALEATYRKHDFSFTEAKIPNNTDVAKAWAMKMGVTESFPRSKGAKAFRELAEELFGIEE